MERRAFTEQHTAHIQQQQQWSCFRWYIHTHTDTELSKAKVYSGGAHSSEWVKSLLSLAVVYFSLLSRGLSKLRLCTCTRVCVCVLLAQTPEASVWDYLQTHAAKQPVISPPPLYIYSQYMRCTPAILSRYSPTGVLSRRSIIELNNFLWQVTPEGCTMQCACLLLPLLHRDYILQYLACLLCARVYLASPLYTLSKTP